MEIIKRTIFNCTEDIIVHQANCQGLMDEGIAFQVKKKYPEIFKAYYYYCKTNQPQDILGTSLICEGNNGKYIASLFGVLSNNEDQKTDYELFRKGLIEIHDFAKEQNLSVAIPFRIGCGLAQGDWDTVFKIIKEVFSDEVICNIYKYRGRAKKS